MPIRNLARRARQVAAPALVGSMITAALAANPSITTTVTPAATSADGKIAYYSYKDGDGDIYVVNPDGTGEVNLTNGTDENSDADQQPAWSPDGTKILFVRSVLNGDLYSDIWVMNADGSDPTPLTNPNDEVSTGSPAWSHDGTQIAFYSTYDPEWGSGNAEIHVMNADGTGEKALTVTDCCIRNILPAFSPDGSRIVFSSSRDGATLDLFTMRASDGGDLTKLTDAVDRWGSGGDWSPVWSPDGEHIAFHSDREADVTACNWPCDLDIFWVRPDGTGLQNLTNDPAALQSDVDFSPSGSEVSFVQYTRNAEGRFDADVYVMPVPGSSTAAQSSEQGDTQQLQLSAVAGARAITDAGDAATPDWGPAEGTVVNSRLTVLKQGRGRVMSDPAGIACGATCVAAFPIGSDVTLTATAAEGWDFSSWAGPCAPATATTCVVDVTGAKQVTAVFTREPKLLTVNKAGSGRGRVVSSPAGVDCGTDCAESVVYGGTVTLTATPVRGSRFAGWSGACTGTGSCVVKMTAARSVTATFQPIS